MKQIIVTKLLARLCLLLPLVCLSLLAQTPDIPQRRERGPSRDPGSSTAPRERLDRPSSSLNATVAKEIFSQADKDGDQKITLPEFTALAEAWFDKLDAEKTGQLTQDQFTSRLSEVLSPSQRSTATATTTGTPSPALESGPESARGGSDPSISVAPTFFAAADTNHDSSVTRTEFKETFTRWFTDWDTNKTGALTEETLRSGLNNLLRRSTSSTRYDRRPRPGGRPRPDRTDSERTLADSPRPSSTSTNNTVGAQSSRSATPSGRDTFAAFKVISERNIFNPNRSARSRGGSAGEEARPKQADSFTLVGTLSSEKGSYAFFESSVSQYKKVLEPGKTIAGYKIADITVNGIVLETGTNKIQLRIGMQMRREEEGPWLVASSSDAQASATTKSDESSEASSSSEENDIAKRLMRRREQEGK